MGRKANPALIGGFVVGAIALAVAGILVFGSGQMFKHTVRFICFFPGAVDGLNVGAPVRFKGVEVGSVIDIRLRLGERGGKEAITEDIARGIRIPVTIEIDRDHIIAQGGKADVGRPADMQRLINLGLRAQLASQSLVTGLLFVQLDFRPDTPITLALPPGSKPAEIPTIPTAMEQVQSAAQQVLKRLDDLKIEHLVQSASDALQAFTQVANAPGLKRTLEVLPDTIANINQTVASFRALATQLDAREGPLLESIKATSDKTTATLEQARATLQSMQVLVAPDSPLAVQLAASLQEVSGAARSLRLLAEYLERNPSAVVRGKDTSTP